MKKRPLIIIGSGLAGYMLAKEFRKLDPNYPMMMITSNDGAFYSKPLLSTSFTAKRTATKIATADVAAMSEQLKMDIQTATTVTKINTTEKIVETLSGSFPYEKLVLATGSAIINAPVLGDAVDSILSVNDLEDYARFCEFVADKKKIAILGAGLVGCEFANDLANTGHEVHVIDPAYYPLQRLLPEKVGRVLEKALSARGVNWHLGKLVSEINHHQESYHLMLSHQELLEVEVVMSAIGLRPNVGLAEAAEIKTNYGILVDRYLQTSHPDIYALGDCAEVGGLVLFFVAPLLRCASALANTLANNPTEVVYPVMPVVLKTPSCPIVIASPPRNLLGEWTVEGEDNNLRALYHDHESNIAGFVLTGKMVVEKNKWVEVMSPLLT
ncbi:MAG: FAD-dependent oxidoreductase [Gammaproteobacteria bacterium]|nr:FAD-dependent oxidoreductase [Gammaproteobacteria bacterium]